MQQTINNSEDLKDAILRLENRQSGQLMELKEGIREEYEKIKPINFIKTFLHDVGHLPELKAGAVTTGVGLAAGLLVKKFIVGSSMNPIKHILGNAVEMGAATLAAKNLDKIKAAVLTGLTFMLKRSKKKVVYQLGEY